jgi:hypothetical protein
MEDVRRFVRNVRSRAGAVIATTLMACGSSYDPGVQVELLSQQSTSADPARSTARGAVRFVEVRWTSTEVELIACPNMLLGMKNWLVPAAHAHGTSTPTLQAVPTVVSAIGNASVQLGSLAPPAGHYCSVRYRVAPADGDAVGLTSAPAMLGTSLLIRGAIDQGDNEPRDFQLISQRAFDLSLDIDISLSSQHSFASLLFGCDTERLLRNIDVGSLAVDGDEEAVLDAFKSSFGVRVE